MYRNIYDNDVTVWSPQGRIHQIEYAMEAVKQVQGNNTRNACSHILFMFFCLYLIILTLNMVTIFNVNIIRYNTGSRSRLSHETMWCASL